MGRDSLEHFFKINHLITYEYRFFCIFRGFRRQNNQTGANYEKNIGIKCVIAGGVRHH
jgi:hypothetical protein